MLVKFKTFGANSAFGSFAPGDLLRCDDAMARHLVEEVQVAEYASAPVAAEQADDSTAATRKRPRR